MCRVVPETWQTCCVELVGYLTQIGAWPKHVADQRCSHLGALHGFIAESET